MNSKGLKFSAVYHYVIAVVAVITATAVRGALDPVLGREAPYLSFTFAILLVGQFQGRGPALLCTAASTLVIWWYFLEPRYSFALASPIEAAGLAMFTVVGVVISVLTSHVHALLISSARSEALLRKQLQLLNPHPSSIDAAKPILAERNGRTAGTDDSILGKLERSPHFVWLSFPVLLLLIQTGLFFQLWKVYRDHEFWTVHTHEVLEKIESFQLSMQGAEAGQREYLLTGIDAYLESYSQAMKDAGVQFEELQKMTADDPRQQSSLGKLRPLVAERFDRLASAVKARQTGGLLAAVEAVKTNRGKQIMVQIQTVVSAMQAEELSLLGRRNEAMSNTASSMMASMVGGTGLLLLVFVMGTRIIDRHIRLERAAHEALLDTQERLANLDKKELMEAVHTRTAELCEALGDLEEMSYSLVHDMRAPLRAMRGFAQMLEEECAGSLPGEGLEYLRRIQAASDRMDRLITDALEYNKIAREELPLTPVDLASMLREMVDTYPNLQPKVADIEIGFQELLVLGNKSLLTQCFRNLLDNAVKFVTPGARPEVRVCTDPRGDAVRIWVEDHGIGIPKEAHERIFKIFQRMHQEEYPGAGIGLATVRKAVERMGGQVGLESEPGAGSRFWVELKSATSNAHSSGEAANRGA